MKISSYPFSDVEIVFTQEDVPAIKNPVYKSDILTITQDFCLLCIPNVADYYVEKYKIIIKPHIEDQSSVELFLNGTVLGANLLQRLILPFHGSSIEHNNKGVLFCGRSGSGKSSMVTKFYLHGAKFISDDITPIYFQNDNPVLGKLKLDVKLWSNSIDELSVEQYKKDRIRDGIDKHYLNIDQISTSNTNLDVIIVLNRANVASFSFKELKGIEKYNTLRQNIYRLALLKGMPKSKEVIFSQLIKISQKTKVLLVNIPLTAKINESYEFINNNVL